MSEYRSFYTYALFRRNGEPFWIGKGKGERYRAHIQYVKFGKSYKDNIICGILDQGLEIPIVRITENMTESEAFAQEISLIRIIGRYPNGPLANLTDGGEGPSGYKASVETRRKQSAAGKGKPKSIETRIKMSESWRNGRRQPMSDEQYLELCKRNKEIGNRPEIKEARRLAALKHSHELIERNKSRKGIPLSNATREIMSNSHQKRLARLRKEGTLIKFGHWFHTLSGKNYTAFEPRDPSDLPGRLPLGHWWHTPDSVRYVAKERRSVDDLPGKN